MRLPRTDVEIESTRFQFVAIPIVSCVTQQIFQPPSLVPRIGKGNSDIALTLIGGVIHDNEQPFVVYSLHSLPEAREETIRGPVSIPGGFAFEQLPLAVAYHCTAKHGKQPVVELLKVLIDGLVRPSDQMGRDTFPSAFELPLMKEAQTRRQERNDGCSFMNFG